MDDQGLLAELARVSRVDEGSILDVLNAIGPVVLKRLDAGKQVQIRGLAKFHRSAAGEVLVQLDPAVSGVPKRPAWWNEPEHQEARRLANTIVSDLALYQQHTLPALSRAMTDDVVAQRCSEALGQLWQDAQRTFVTAVDQAIRSQCDHLIDTARQRWSSDPVT